MSPRAAWRLDSLGYTAYDYVPGKADWLAFGLPYEGAAELIGDLVTRDVPTCGLRERLGDVRERLTASRLGIVVVLGADGIVLGRLDAAALDAEDDTPVEHAMSEGPTTVRPSEEAPALAERIRRASVDGVLVTRSDGTLLGVFEHR